MMMQNKYPILEFDDNKEAIINPGTWAGEPFKTNKLVITFFPEVIEKLAAEGRIVPERRIGGENPILLYRFADENILITLGAVGCPSCAGNLDLFHAMGISSVMFCGGGGVLDKNIEVGQIRGLTWTTDAVFRETKDKVKQRKAEGAKIVEMEQAGCIAVAQYRGFSYGALIYGGDDVSSKEWSDRGWRSRDGIRFDLVTLCKKLVTVIGSNAEKS